MTGNYKMTFDSSARALAGRDAWILVLDTRGINVWCAAGKGTFGTDELVQRIEVTRPPRIVSHRTLILPQLGAPGVAAHEVATPDQVPGRLRTGPGRGPAGLPRRRLEGRAGDAPGPLRLQDRIVLAPGRDRPDRHQPGVPGSSPALWIAGLVGLKIFAFSLPAVLGALLIGAVVVPALLPWIPGPELLAQGLAAGDCSGRLASWLARGMPATPAGWVSAASYLLMPARPVRLHRHGLHRIEPHHVAVRRGQGNEDGRAAHPALGLPGSGGLDRVRVI